MLKIKDNIDLKELEKFGYFQSSNGEYYKRSELFGESVEIFIQEDKSFFIEWGWYVMCGEEQDRFLEDLIKADLVEKVESDK